MTATSASIKTSLSTEAVKLIQRKENVVKRLIKDYQMYIKEETDNFDRIQKLKDEGKDEYVRYVLYVYVPLVNVIFLCHV